MSLASGDEPSPYEPSSLSPREGRVESLVTAEGLFPARWGYGPGPNEEGAPPRLASRQRDSLAGRQVLVVDDDQLNLEIAARHLNKRGAWVTLATHGQEALDLLRLHPRGWDAVLMDIRMPGLDGFETTRRIRTELGLSHLPIIACTSEPLPAIWRELAEVGIDDYQPKPIEADDLLETLLRWISPEPTR